MKLIASNPSLHDNLEADPVIRASSREELATITSAVLGVDEAFVDRAMDLGLVVRWDLYAPSDAPPDWYEDV